MDDPLVSGLVGAAIALVAAFLTSITDVLKRRWSVRTETASWRRQTMFTFAHEYVEAAFALAGNAGNARKERIDGRPLAELQGHLDRCHTAHGEMILALTALRLVAPRNVVTAAETAHDSSHRLINVAMGERGQVPGGGVAVILRFVGQKGGSSPFWSSRSGSSRAGWLL